ncbi:MAG: HAD family phosphatase [Patescibacteria group bacterium]|jgi:HAD superfamily hydrolase (TIGR01509 family)
MMKAVIYDMDDLMVNSNPLHAKAWELLLKRYGHSFKELPESMRSRFIGMRITDILNEIAQYFHLDEDINTLYKARAEVFLEMVKRELDAMPGLIESLTLLKKRSYPLALASSGTREYIQIVLTRFHIEDYFDVIISGDDVVRGKPDPETYRIAAQKLKIDPSHCIVLEDATNGITSAKAAGCKCIAVRNPYTPQQDLSRADAIIDSLRVLSPTTLESI